MNLWAFLMRSYNLYGVKYGKSRHLIEFSIFKKLLEGFKMLSSCINPNKGLGISEIKSAFGSAVLCCSFT